MPTVLDFRLASFDADKIAKSGRSIGKETYWKLYSIENTFRIVVHSILSIQIPQPQDWWLIAVDKTIRDKAQRYLDSYTKKSWHGNPGAHGIYYIDLKDLNEIMRVNAHLFRPAIPDFDKWILGLEELRLPRNIVAHMNYPNKTDKARIDVFYHDCKTLIGLIANKIPLTIP